MFFEYFPKNNNLQRKTIDRFFLRPFDASCFRVRKMYARFYQNLDECVYETTSNVFNRSRNNSGR